MCIKTLQFKNISMSLTRQFYIYLERSSMFYRTTAPYMMDIFMPNFRDTKYISQSSKFLLHGDLKVKVNKNLKE